MLANSIVSLGLAIIFICYAAAIKLQKEQQQAGEGHSGSSKKVVRIVDAITPRMGIECRPMRYESSASCANE